MVSTIETTEAELSDNFSSPTPPSSSSEMSNRAASSLVQIWEKRLNNNSNQSDDATSIDESSYSDSTSSSERVLSSSNETTSCSSSSQTLARGVSDAAAERVRVADIIKRFKLSCGDHESNNDQYCNNNMAMMGSSSSGCLTRSRSLTKLRVRPNNNNNSSMTMLTEPKAAQHTSFLHVLSSPRIRGRRAFTDLLMHMERERYGELKLLGQKAAVSKFSQKGRIQSMLRLKLLQRGQCRRDSSSTTTTSFEVNKPPQGSAIMHLRERFNIKVESQQTEVGSPRSSHHHQQISKDPQNNNTHSHTQIINEEEPIISVIIPSSSETLCLQAQSINNVDPQPHNNDHQEEEVEINNVEAHQNAEEIVETITIDSNENDDEEAKVEEVEEKYDNHNSSTIIAEADQSSNYVMEERVNNNNNNNNNIEEEEDGNYEELEGEEGSDEQQYYDEEDDETYFDWISHISRPRSYWEDRRQAWYKEMLDSTCTSDKQPEIRQLLERRTVSTFLSSDFRERMDKLMESHIGTQTHLTWSYRDSNDQASEDSDRIESSSSTHHQPSSISLSQSPFQDNHNSSSSSSITRHSSNIEMELIYDLRGQMEQMHREMIEIRNSIKACMDMQMAFQQSMKREVKTVKEKKKKSHERPKKGNCCICYEKKVDSVLYRCGHMCACLKCANELQWNSGKCPICWAPIVDVVRVYVNE
ncbi:RING/U-box superfamily protein [Senna tora]|uniref:RING/U-box superfamily protein n=1 Tax=Senna tora TaxID=362788 RepID=A0A834SF18_9FABA|nr:RING/U-box superfamily protein [Senna tora]